MSLIEFEDIACHTWMLYDQHISSIELILRHPFLNSRKESILNIKKSYNTNDRIGKTQMKPQKKYEYLYS